MRPPLGFTPRSTSTLISRPAMPETVAVAKLVPGGAAQTAADTGAGHAAAGCDDALRALAGTPVAGQQRSAGVVRARRQRARPAPRPEWCRRRSPGCRPRPRPAHRRRRRPAGPRSGLVERESKVGLLRGADVDDVGVLVERAADAGGQLLLRADLLATFAAAKIGMEKRVQPGAMPGTTASLEPAMME